VATYSAAVWLTSHHDSRPHVAVRRAARIHRRAPHFTSRFVAARINRRAPHFTSRFTCASLTSHPARITCARREPPTARRTGSLLRLRRPPIRRRSRIRPAARRARAATTPNAATSADNRLEWPCLELQRFELQRFELPRFELQRFELQRFELQRSGTVRL